MEKMCNKAGLKSNIHYIKTSNSSKTAAVVQIKVKQCHSGGGKIVIKIVPVLEKLRSYIEVTMYVVLVKLTNHVFYRSYIFRELLR